MEKDCIKCSKFYQDDFPHRTEIDDEGFCGVTGTSDGLAMNARGTCRHFRHLGPYKSKKPGEEAIAKAEGK